jgi:hypothetical protein
VSAEPKIILICGVANAGPTLGLATPLLCTPGGVLLTSGGSGGNPAGLFTGGSLITYASPSGVTNNVNPPGWLTTPNTVGRINVTLAAGNAEWTGLDAAGITDGTGVLITNTDAANTLQLDTQNAGSSAANQFFASGNIVLVPGQGTLAVYYLAEELWFIR